MPFPFAKCNGPCYLDNGHVPSPFPLEMVIPAIVFFVVLVVMVCITEKFIKNIFLSTLLSAMTATLAAMQVFALFQ